MQSNTAVVNGRRAFGLCPSPNLMEFVERYDERALVNRSRRQERNEKARATGKPLPEFIENQIKGRKAAEKAVLKKLGGKLRSELHPILKMFVARVHRAHKLLTGDAKDILEPCDSKMLALESAYTAFNAQMIGLIRTDLDGTWKNVAAFRADLYDCLPVAAWPAFAVFATDREGRVIRPHVYHVLAKSVCATKNGRSGPRKLLKQVARGLVEALLPMGADPGALCHSLHGKNPCCWKWELEILSGELCTLSGLSNYVRLGVHEADLCRGAAEVRVPQIGTKAGAVVPSNQFFNELAQHARQIVGEFKAAEADYQEFAATMAVYACEISLAAEEANARSIALRVADYVWTHHDPSKRQQDRRDRGACRHLLAAPMDLQERQTVGAKHTAQKRRDASQSAILAAYENLVAAGQKPTQKAVSEASSVSLSTVKRHWSVVAGEGVRRCIAKKEVMGAADTTAKGEKMEKVVDSKPTAAVVPRLVIVWPEQDTPPPEQTDGQNWPWFRRPGGGWIRMPEGLWRARPGSPAPGWAGTPRPIERGSWAMKAACPRPSRHIPDGRRCAA